MITLAAATFFVPVIATSLLRPKRKVWGAVLAGALAGSVAELSHAFVDHETHDLIYVLLTLFAVPFGLNAGVKYGVLFSLQTAHALIIATGILAHSDGYMVLAYSLVLVLILFEDRMNEHPA